MKKTLCFVIAAAVLLACLPVLALGQPAAGSGVSEDLNASADYLVFSPQYNGRTDQWEMWVYSFQTRSGKKDYQTDRCLSAVNLTNGSGSTAARKLESLLKVSYSYDNGGPEASEKYGYMEYYIFRPKRIPCYLDCGGGSNTDAAPVSSLSIVVMGQGSYGYDLSLWTESGDFSSTYLVYCQMQRIYQDYRQIPYSIIGVDEYQEELRIHADPSLYASEFSNADRLYSYCRDLVRDNLDGYTYIDYGTEKEYYQVTIDPYAFSVDIVWR